ncbi:MAG: hypothetical protein IAE97_06365 [Chthoniobacterales bacterium]|nr:hypothetical protein [Chthoniobacterales bacterium]
MGGNTGIQRRAPALQLPDIGRGDTSPGNLGQLGFLLVDPGALRRERLESCITGLHTLGNGLLRLLRAKPGKLLLLPLQPSGIKPANLARAAGLEFLGGCQQVGIHLPALLLAGKQGVDLLEACRALHRHRLARLAVLDTLAPHAKPPRLRGRLILDRRKPLALGPQLGLLLVSQKRKPGALGAQFLDLGAESFQFPPVKLLGRCYAHLAIRALDALLGVDGVPWRRLALVVDVLVLGRLQVVATNGLALVGINARNLAELVAHFHEGLAVVAILHVALCLLKQRPALKVALVLPFPGLDVSLGHRPHGVQFALPPVVRMDRLLIFEPLLLFLLCRLLLALPLGDAVPTGMQPVGIRIARVNRGIPTSTRANFG